MEEIRITLMDETQEGNKQLAKLVDQGRWQQLVSQYDGGRGEFTIEELIEWLIEGN